MEEKLCNSTQQMFINAFTFFKIDSPLIESFSGTTVDYEALNMKL